MTRHLALALCIVIATAASAASQEAPASGGFQMAPRAYVQLDWRGYPDWDVATGTGRLNRDTWEFRRLRFGLDSEWRRAAFELTVDPQDEDGVFLKDAYGQWRFSRGFRVRVGQFKVPGSREYGRTARTLDYLERAALADTAAPGRDVGGSVFGDVGDRWSYEAGVFTGDGNGRPSRADTTGAGRVEFGLTGDIEIGGSFSLGRVEAVDTGDPNGLVGRSTSGYRFFEQVYVHGWRVRAGGDVRWESGPWRIDGEVLRVGEERAGQGLEFEDLPDLVSVGWSASLTHRLFRRNGANRVRSREIELAIRVDSLAFDDSGPRTDLDSVRPRATDIRPRGVLTTTAGVSWEPNPWIRVMTNAAWEHYDETRAGPRPGRSGFLTLGTRLQVGLP